MSKNKSNTNVFSEATKPLKDELNRQKLERQARKELWKGKMSFGDFLKTWALRLVYTAMMLMSVYLLILCGTVFVPPVLAYILAGLGYQMTTNVDILLSAMCGLFLTAWVFTITFFIVKKILKCYTRGMKSTMSKEAVERMENL